MLSGREVPVLPSRRQASLCSRWVEKAIVFAERSSGCSPTPPRDVPLGMAASAPHLGVNEQAGLPGLRCEGQVRASAGPPRVAVPGAAARILRSGSASSAGLARCSQGTNLRAIYGVPFPRHLDRGQGFRTGARGAPCGDYPEQQWRVLTPRLPGRGQDPLLGSEVPFRVLPPVFLPRSIPWGLQRARLYATVLFPVAGGRQP